MTALTTGQMAPNFSQPNQDNQTVSLSDFANKQTVVLYFYPKDDTPGCTIQANEFSALADAFAKVGTTVIGVSKDSCDSHQAFISKFDLRLNLLADTDGTLCADYDVWREKEKKGVKKMGIVRSTFVINKDGKLIHAEYGATTTGHAQAMLDLVTAL